MIEFRIDVQNLTPADLQYVCKWINMIAQDKQSIMNELRISAEAEKWAKQIAGETAAPQPAAPEGGEK